MPFCSEAWDAIARYIYTGLQGGSIMKGWMKEENTMITCCSDGTRPVIFKIAHKQSPLSRFYPYYQFHYAKGFSIICLIYPFSIIKKKGILGSPLS